MEFQFENTTIPEKKIFAETFRRLHKMWLFILIGSVGYMLYMAYRFVEAYLNNVIWLDYIFWFVFYFAFAIFALVMPSISVERSFRAMRRQNLGQPVVMVKQFGDRIVSSYAGSVNTLDCCNMKRVYSLKTCYVILFKSNMAILIMSRDGFTKGTFEEFKQFLREKRPDLIIPE